MNVLDTETYYMPGAPFIRPPTCCMAKIPADRSGAALAAARSVTAAIQGLMSSKCWGHL